MHSPSIKRVFEAGAVTRKRAVAGRAPTARMISPSAANLQLGAGRGRWVLACDAARRATARQGCADKRRGAAGAKLVIGDILDDLGRQTEAETAEAGGRCRLRPPRRDQRKRSGRAPVSAAVERFGRLGILANNAGILARGRQRVGRRRRVRRRRTPSARTRIAS